MTHKITFATCALATLALAGPASAEHRQLGPHVHGHGTLNMAIEGNKVSMALEVPGMDIVGFEHGPSTPEQKATAKAAEAKLKDALNLFAVPESAECKLDSAKIEIEYHDDADHDEDHDGDEHTEDHHKDHANADHGDGHDAEEHESHGRHTEYDVAYAMTCAKATALSSIHFNYFSVFPGAKSITVNFVSNDRQGSYEVTRAKPDVDLREGM